jgi:hypothetical protein
MDFDLLNISSKEEFISKAKWGLLAMVGVGGLNLVNHMVVNRNNEGIQLSIEVDALANDPIIMHALSRMEKYKKLNPIYFEAIVSHLDELYCIHRALKSKAVNPSIKLLDKAFVHFRQSTNRLKDFRCTIETYLGEEDAVAFEPYIVNIYKQAQDEVLNIVAFCRHFNPQSFAESAEQRINRLLADQKQKLKRQRKHERHEKHQMIYANE